MAEYDDFKPTPRESEQKKKRRARAKTEGGRGKVRDITPKKERTGKFPWKAVILTFLFTAVGAGLVGLYLSYNYEERKYAYTRQTIVIQESDALNAMKESLEGGDAALTAVRKGFKNYIVTYNKAGAYVFKPINYDLKLHNRKSKDVKKLPSGEWRYEENLRTLSHKGIDVSSHQEEIDWKKVAADGVEYVMVRAGLRGYETGKLVEDQRVGENLKGAAENGIKTGAYFVTQATTPEEVDEEVEFLLKTIEPYEVKGPVAVDVEPTAEGNGRADDLSAKDRTDLVIRFCEKLKEAGYTPMIYYNFEMAVLLTEVERLEDYAKWYASYSSDLYYPYYYSIWQYSANGHVDGISENVDLNMVFDTW